MPAMPSLGSWTYVPPGTTEDDEQAWGDVDEVRFWMQDTNSDVRFMADLEIQWLIDQWVSKYDTLVYVAAVALETLATKFAGVTSVSADGVAVNVGDISEKFAKRAAALRELHKESQVGGEIDITNLMWDQNPDFSIDPLVFGVGMDDNIEAGRQNYGSHRRMAWPYGEGDGWY